MMSKVAPRLSTVVTVGRTEGVVVPNLCLVSLVVPDQLLFKRGRTTFHARALFNTCVGGHGGEGADTTAGSLQFKIKMKILADLIILFNFEILSKQKYHLDRKTLHRVSLPAPPLTAAVTLALAVAGALEQRLQLRPLPPPG